MAEEHRSANMAKYGFGWRNQSANVELGKIWLWLMARQMLVAQWQMLDIKNLCSVTLSSPQITVHVPCLVHATNMLRLILAKCARLEDDKFLGGKVLMVEQLTTRAEEVNDEVKNHLMSSISFPRNGIKFCGVTALRWPHSFAVLILQFPPELDPQ